MLLYPEAFSALEAKDKENLVILDWFAIDELLRIV